MPIKASLNQQLLRDAYTDWEGIYLDRAARQIDTNNETRRKTQEDLEQKQLRDYNFGKLKADQMSKLVVSSESPHQGVQDYLQMMSGQLVDRQSDLINLYQDGQIDSTQFAAQTAKLQAQVPQIKGFVTQLDTGLGLYSTGLAQKSLSKAMSPDDDYLWKAITEGKGEFGMDENNVLVYQGKTDNGEDFSFPANKLNQMPMPFLKVDSFEQNTLPLAVNLAKPVDTQLPDGTWSKQSMSVADPRFKESIRASFDSFLENNGGELALRSLAADHAGYTRERINTLMHSGEFEGPDGETYANKLEYEMEQDWLASAADQYQNFVTEQFNAQMENQRLQQEKNQIALMNAQNQRNMGRTEKERKRFESASHLRKLPPPTLKDSWKWLEGTGWRVVTQKGKSYLIQGRDQDTAVELTPEQINDPNRLAQVFAGRAYNLSPDIIKFNYN